MPAIVHTQFMTLIIIALLLFLIYALLMALYAAGWHLQKEQAAKEYSGSLPRLSVIIPARNEAAHIEACLRSILQNEYPAHLLEIIVIDDFSTDNTAALASALLPPVKGRVLHLEQYLSSSERLNSYKKKALEIAIKEAKGEWIVTTDADCIVSATWLGSLAAATQDPATKFIAAPVSFSPALGRKNTLYYFQSIDFMTMQGITAASARLNLGNMCNGANLAFSKAAFAAVGGYEGIDHIASGDDMMLMHKIQQHFPEGICYLKSTAAMVHTPAQPTWRSFLNQRIRWSSKADHYDDKKLTVILAFVYLFNLSFIPLGIAACIDPGYRLWLLVLLLAKVLTELAFLVPVAVFYRKTQELLLFPLLQPLHILYIIMAGFLGKFGTYHWKGRQVK
jgi:cellulose synthase/poly-beta-1,6-N-acetylglucosamine synthase-like glycosyltransferase